MKYLYFPGCSLKSTGRAYEESLLAVFRKLGIVLEEIDDWNCCGATNYMAINEHRAIAITTRNLALAEQQVPDGEVHVVVPCNACYMGLLKTQNYLENEESLREKVIKTIAESGLNYQGRVKIRHPLDVLINDFGLDVLKANVITPLSGVRVISYYGCQMVRPIATFDSEANPVSLDQVASTLGATAVDWGMKLRCCGGSMTSTIPDVGRRLNYLLLREAKEKKGDVIITACPLCQFNLECFQNKISKKYRNDIKIPVMFFTQLMGMALGIPEQDLGIQRLFVKPKFVYA